MIYNLYKIGSVKKIQDPVGQKSLNPSWSDSHTPVINNTKGDAASVGAEAGGDEHEEEVPEGPAQTGPTLYRGTQTTGQRQPNYC